MTSILYSLACVAAGLLGLVVLAGLLALAVAVWLGGRNC